MDKRRAKLISELKGNINQYLENFCDAESTPYLCDLRQSKEGYKQIEDFVIKAFFESDMSVSDALVQKENMLNPNYLTD
jgi:hypothetical protein